MADSFDTDAFDTDAFDTDAFDMQTTPGVGGFGLNVVTVADPSGVAYATALATLTGQGLTVVRVNQASALVAAGTVISHSVANTAITTDGVTAYATTVTLNVSSGIAGGGSGLSTLNYFGFRF